MHTHWRARYAAAARTKTNLAKENILIGFRGGDKTCAHRASVSYFAACDWIIGAIVCAVVCEILFLAVHSRHIDIYYIFFLRRRATWLQFIYIFLHINHMTKWVRHIYIPIIHIFSFLAYMSMHACVGLSAVRICFFFYCELPIFVSFTRCSLFINKNRIYIV